MTMKVTDNQYCRLS